MTCTIGFFSLDGSYTMVSCSISTDLPHDRDNSEFMTAPGVRRFFQQFARYNMRTRSEIAADCGESSDIPGVSEYLLATYASPLSQ